MEVQEISAVYRDLGHAFTVQILSSGRLYVWKDIDPSIPDLASRGVVYRYWDRTDYIYAKDEKATVRKPGPGFASAFAIPTFGGLEHALEHYKVNFVRYSSCPILSKAWYNAQRIFLKPGPESTMQDSLTHFLRVSLRDAEVRPEQNMNKTRPIDIKVTWGFSNRIALIEIKWLGTPKYEDGHLGTPYTEARARAGAQQLSDYLDANRAFAATHITRGYLVVIDARRANLRPDTIALSHEDGIYYRDREIRYDPPFHTLRDDFAQPVRMFCEPKSENPR